MDNQTNRRIIVKTPVRTGMNVLVVYTTQGGNTKRVAEDIAALLGADIERVVDRKKRSGFFNFLISGRDAIRKNLTDIEPSMKDPTIYDMVILGSPLWGFGSMTPAIRTYLTQYEGRIKRNAIFCTNWFSKQEKFFASFAELTGSRPIATLGLMAKELNRANFALYEEKVREFVEQLCEK
ncbi:hypothetical protein LLG96_19410 [bacterium]|nr:hypothetical protein [bacterium]